MIIHTPTTLRTGANFLLGRSIEDVARLASADIRAAFPGASVRTSRGVADHTLVVTVRSGGAFDSAAVLGGAIAIAETYQRVSNVDAFTNFVIIPRIAA